MTSFAGFLRTRENIRLFGAEFLHDCLYVGKTVVGDDNCGIGGDCDFAKSDDGIVCLFTGLLLNRKELTETIRPCANSADICIELYKQHGNDFATRLNGPFACAIWERDKGKLLLVRDQLGQAVLFYSFLASGDIIFSTDLPTLRRFPGCSERVDVKALSDYLSLGYIPAPRTIYHGVSRLPAAHWMCLHSVGGLTAIHRYWYPPFVPKCKLTMNEATEHAWQLLDKAVNRCLAAQPSSVVLLSGGIDSNLVMALCTTAETPVTSSFTVGFSDSAYDERLLAKHSAEALHVQNIQAEISPDAWDELPALQRLNGEPFADSSLIPTTVAMRLASSNGYSCVLTGSGGDELFGGYRRYQAMRLRAVLGCLPSWLLHAVGRLGIAMTPAGADARSRQATIRRFSTFLCQRELEGYTGFQQMFSDEMKAQLVRDSHLRSQPSYLEDWEKLSKDGIADNLVEEVNELDVLTYLPEDGCVKERLAGSAVGIGGLCPIMDMEVVEFGLSLPRALRVTLTERKRVLRRIGRSLLTPELLSQTKRGFGMPVSAWFRGPKADIARALSADLRQWDEHGWFDEAAVRQLVDEHLSGRADHGARLWTLLCLRHWLGK